MGTASARHVTFLRDLGTDDVIDYTKGRFEDQIREVDVVLDTIRGDTLERSWGVLRRGGVLVTLAGTVSEEEAVACGVKGVFFVVKPN
jgi:NADPH:quinone reductase-like Zn-dependent oxidoreductase